MSRLIKYRKPFSMLEELRESLYDLFERETDSPTGSAQLSTTWRPTVNLSETEQAYHVSAELPGMKEDDINVYVDGNTLTISGTKREQSEDEGENYHRIERRFGSFQRSFALPAAVVSDDVEASYADGGAFPKRWRSIG